MSRIDRIEDVPSLTLAFLAGRWIAIAQIECNAQSGYEHTIEQHAAAAAVVYVLNGREPSVATADMAAAVDALGEMIRQTFRGGETNAQFPPSPMVLAEIVRCANEALSL